MTTSIERSASDAGTAGPAEAGTIEPSRAFVDATRGLRVALVHDWLNGMRGGEKVLEAIAAHFPSAPIYTLFCVPEAISPALRRHDIRVSMLQRTVPGRLLRSSYRYLLAAFPRAIEEFELGGFDLVVSTSHCVAKGVLPAPEALHLSYCHSPMRYAWDLERQYFPRRRGPVAAARGAVLSALRVWDVASTPRVDAFWANSRFVARRIERFYDREAEVLPPPVDVERFAAPAGEETTVRRGVVAVSALVPYKRLDLAIDACERLGVDLTIVGDGPERKRLAARCRQHARLLGHVDGRELQRLLRSARLFVQPGVEDFGIATVEALAAGTPVVAIDRGGACDIVEPPTHGLLVPEGDVAALAQAIDTALEMEFNSLKLVERAKEFSGDRFAARFQRSLVASLHQHVSGSLRRLRPSSAPRIASNTRSAGDTHEVSPRR
ncbi:MAG: glycosyltransferase [Acidobacteriota bacterium]